jgi:hypothetical protein
MRMPSSTAAQMGMPSSTAAQMGMPSTFPVDMGMPPTFPVDMGMPSSTAAQMGMPSSTATSQFGIVPSSTSVGITNITPDSFNIVNEIDENSVIFDVEKMKSILGEINNEFNNLPNEQHVSNHVNKVVEIFFKDKVVREEIIGDTLHIYISDRNTNNESFNNLYNMIRKIIFHYNDIKDNKDIHNQLTNDNLILFHLSTYTPSVSTGAPILPSVSTGAPILPSVSTGAPILPSVSTGSIVTKQATYPFVPPITKEAKPVKPTRNMMFDMVRNIIVILLIALLAYLFVKYNKNNLPSFQ